MRRHGHLSERRVPNGEVAEKLMAQIRKEVEQEKAAKVTDEAAAGQADERRRRVGRRRGPAPVEEAEAPPSAAAATAVATTAAVMLPPASGGRAVGRWRHAEGVVCQCRGVDAGATPITPRGNSNVVGPDLTRLARIAAVKKKKRKD